MEYSLTHCGYHDNLLGVHEHLRPIFIPSTTAIVEATPKYPDHDRQRRYILLICRNINIEIQTILITFIGVPLVAQHSHLVGQVLDSIPGNYSRRFQKSEFTNWWGCKWYSYKDNLF